KSATCLAPNCVLAWPIGRLRTRTRLLTSSNSRNFSGIAVIRQLNRLSEKRRSFKRGLWGSCVATLMPHKGDSCESRDAAPPASFHLNVAKDRFLNGLSAAQKSPRLAQGALVSPRKRYLSPYRNAGLSIRRAKLIHANALGGGRDYQFHPDGIRTLEIRSLGRLAQGVEAVLLLPGGRVGETRQLEHDP